MRWSAAALAVLVACQAQAAPATAPPPTSLSAVSSTLSVAIADEQCARRTFDSLIAAVNAADEGRLSSLVGGSFQWLGVMSADNLQVAGSYEVKGAIEVLLGIGRSGETWTLKHLDVNGRGWHGGVDFGIEIRRAGPGLPRPYLEAAGKGVLDCPAERVLLFGLGYGRVPRAVDPRS